MKDLIERLEKATEGSGELDGLIASIALDWTWQEDDYWVNHKGVDRDLPPFTTSLDAKLPGENITDMAWHEVVPGEQLGEICEAWHEDQKTGERTLGQGHTEAIARRCASLRARSQP